jgi:LysM repeat protein
MNAQTARSRRASRESSPIYQRPSWLKWLVIGLLVMLAVAAILFGNWVLRSGSLGQIKLFQPEPERVYLPLMVSNPTADPKLALQPTQEPEPQPAYVLTEYKIRSGDTLYQIALSNDISLELLLAANPKLDEYSILNIGDIILIPPEDIEVADMQNITISTIKSEQSESSTADPTPAKKTPPALASRLSEINGVPVDQIIVLPPEVIENIRNVYLVGYEKGRNAQAFAKIGDSTIESPFFMDRFDEGSYNLGDYAFLQKAINFFQGSFARQGPSVQRGLHAWSLFDPMWTNYEDCMSGESPAECEFRLQNPGFVFIRLGSNDAGRPDLFTSGMKQLIEMSLKRGIIPILGTKADRNEGDNENNQIIRQLASDYDVPLWDFDKLAQTLPNNGIGEDGVHLTTFYAHDFSLPEALQTGYGAHTLTALMMLYELWRLLVRS